MLRWVVKVGQTRRTCIKSSADFAFDKIFKMADTWRESSTISITAFVGYFGKLDGVITLKACKEARIEI
jgi:hypothetical protein